MIDRLADARLRVARAQLHADEFRRVSDEFMLRNRCTDAIEPHANGSYDLLKLKFGAPLPADFALLGAEVFWHLRSALDSVGYSIALAVNASHPGDSHFPFGDDSRYVNGQGPRSKALPKEIFAFMRKLKPYKGGHVGLSALNDACNRCKHEMLTPTPVCAAAGIFRQLHVVGGRAKLLDPPAWDREKNELTLAAVERGAKLKYDFDLVFDICFDDPEPFVGKPAVGILDDLVREIARIVGAIETEARRLKIIA